jgi:hypothetical protein
MADWVLLFYGDSVDDWKNWGKDADVAGAGNF